MSGADERLPEPSSPDADALTKALEIELQLKRASWQRARARRNLWRVLSFLFLMLVILAALGAYFFLQPQLHRGSAEKPRPAAEENSR